MVTASAKLTPFQRQEMQLMNPFSFGRAVGWLRFFVFSDQFF
jgi:hypothetical protein